MRRVQAKGCSHEISTNLVADDSLCRLPAGMGATGSVGANPSLYPACANSRDRIAGLELELFSRELVVHGKNYLQRLGFGLCGRGVDCRSVCVVASIRACIFSVGRSTAGDTNCCGRTVDIDLR